MIAREQTAVRNVGLLLVVRGLMVVSGVIFAAVVPRLMGPSAYGKVALLVALSFWFGLLGNLGFTQVVTRHVPGFLLSDDRAGLRGFFSRLMAIRVALGLLSAVLYSSVTISWLRDLDFAAMLLLAAAVCVRAPASLCFALYLGLNRAARWGVSDIVRQWGMLLFMLPGFLVAGLRGAALGVLLAELVVFAVGFAGARKYLSWSAMRLDFTGMAPYLKFGFVFWIGDLVLSAFERSGEAMLRALSGDYAQVGYFGVSYSAYVAAAVGVPQVALAFASLLAMLRAEGQMEALREWIERLLTWLSVGAVLVAAAAIMLAGDLVPVVLGQAYRPAAANITVLAISIVMLCLSSVASLSALVFDRPGVTLGAALARLVVFWGLGLLLIPRWGSLGASVAVLGALAGQATYFTMRMRPVVGYSLRRWAAVLGLGLALVPLALLKASFLVNLLLFLVFTAAYVAGLFWLRLVTRSELIALLRAVGLARRPRVAGEEAAS